MKEAVKKYAQDEMKLEDDKAVKNWSDGKFSAELIKLENRIFVEVLQGQGRDALRRRLDKKKMKHCTTLKERNTNMKLTHKQEKEFVDFALNRNILNAIDGSNVIKKWGSFNN